MGIKFSQPRFGFSLIEALVVIAVLALLATVSVVSFQNFNRHEALSKDAAKVVAVFEEARALTFGAKSASSYGVHVESAKVVRFTNNVYAAGSTSNVEEVLSPYVTISNISLSGGGSDIIFSRIGGTSTKFGTITLSLISNSSSTKKIKIYSTGLVEITK